MTIHTQRVVADDGTLTTRVWSDDPDAHIILTGPVQGPVTLADGSVVDVSEDFVEASSQAEALAISDAIGLKHVEQGHPDFVADPDLDSLGFVHVASDGTPYINAAAAPETIAEVEAKIEADPVLETGSLVKVEA